LPTLKYNVVEIEPVRLIGRLLDTGRGLLRESPLTPPSKGWSVLRLTVSGPGVRLVARDRR
jgi:hypothetical protein